MRRTGHKPCRVWVSAGGGEVMGRGKWLALVGFAVAAQARFADEMTALGIELDWADAAMWAVEAVADDGR